MNRFKEHIAMKAAIVILVAVFLTPSFVKLSHAFADHEHVVCTSNEIAHVHELDIDCEFYKFKISKELSYSVYEPSPIVPEINPEPIKVSYDFIKIFQDIQYGLRAPPGLV